jgi:hypothetical protein
MSAVCLLGEYACMVECIMSILAYDCMAGSDFEEVEVGR